MLTWAEQHERQRQAPRPTVTRNRTTEKTVEFQIPAPYHHEVLCAWLRKTYPEFRGFTTEQIELTFETNGIVHCHARKEEHST